LSDNPENSHTGPSYKEVETSMHPIKRVSREVNVSPKRIRESETEGFIKPDREPWTDYRLYTDFDVERIKRIKHLIHERGFTLSCLRALLVFAQRWNVYDCPTWEAYPAYMNPRQSCRKIRSEQRTDCPGTRQHRAMYLNRDQKQEYVLEREENPW
jgi:DNA-binding transcriptional MerR regulator